MTTVKQVLDAKGHDIWSIDPGSSVLDTIRLMADKKIGALLIMENDNLVGIVSERDYARKVILKGRASNDTPVKDIMTRKIIYATPENSVEDCMELMTKKRVRHLPVLDGDQVVGVLSIGDLVKNIIADQQFTIEQLENYITA
ncbi:MAG: CBS domain-containing protein [Pyrinomonadaceae bacterium]|nr:CBS domain-containing protein [Pyrinomonadaceae bacterium]